MMRSMSHVSRAIMYQSNNVIARDAIHHMHKHFAILTGRYGKTLQTPDTSITEIGSARSYHLKYE